MLKGNRTMRIQEFLEPSEKKAQETKSLEVTFLPTDEDIGKALVCQATLHIYDDDSPPKVRKTTKELEVYSKYLCLSMGIYSWMHTAINRAATVKKKQVCSFYAILIHCEHNSCQLHNLKKAHPIRVEKS